MLTPTQLILLFGVSIWVLVYFRWLKVFSSRKAPLPPGPKPWTIFGNVSQTARPPNWRIFHQWGKIYGDVVFVRLAGRKLVILNSYKAVHDLMVLRSAQYSDRYHRVMGDLCGYSRGLLFLDNNERFRRVRRFVHNHIGGPQAAQYQHFQEAEAAAFVKHLLDTPESFRKHIRRLAGTLILRIAYGYTVKSDDDSFVKLAEEVMGNISETLTYGAFIVEALPFLRHMPAWTPILGRGLRTARDWRKNFDKFENFPYEFVKRQMELGLDVGSFTSKCLSESEQQMSADEEAVVLDAAMSLYAGGTDTVVSIETSFFLAMVLYPDVQKKAQDEIDQVIGSGRFPRFSDRDSLPYIGCIVQECLRWNPVVPLVSHRVRGEDIYRGYSIPAGADVVANVWALTHDETVYPEPMRFLPERFLGKDQRSENTENTNPQRFAFGFGRRICPAIDLAEASVFIVVATTLAMFNISKAKDANGMEITPEEDYTSGALSHAKQFPCEISPRSSQALKLLQELP